MTAHAITTGLKYENATNRIQHRDDTSGVWEDVNFSTVSSSTGVFYGGCIYSYTNGASTPAVLGADGDFIGASTDITASGAHYLHLKFDAIGNTHHRMLRIRLHGQEFGSHKTIDVEGSAYSYGASSWSGINSRIHHSAFAQNSHAGLFYKTITGTYLRITINSSYYLSLGMDSFKTNSGIPIIKGEVTPIFSTIAKL